MSRRTKVVIGVLLFLAIAVIVVASGIVPRLRSRQVLAQQTNAFAQPVVSTVRPKLEPSSQELVLPGNIQAFIDAPIYARTNGYLRRWYFDIGSHVKRGQLLAEIESPEADQQLQQAQEELATARANLKLAEITAARYIGLLRTDSVSKQEVDNAVQGGAAKATVVKSAEANVRRLQEMVGFEKIYAPFDGVITARNTDIGQLIASGPGAAGVGRELFHIGATNKLRVFVNVPQRYSHEMRTGSRPELTLPELPKRHFPGVLVRTADSLDAATRTLLVEVDVQNNSGLLLPNAYTEVHFKLGANARSLVIPSASLAFRSEGLRVPVVVSGNKVAMVPVQLGRDFGRTVEILSGLDLNSAVISDPPDSLVEGETVRVVAAARKPGTAEPEEKQPEPAEN